MQITPANGCIRAPDLGRTFKEAVNTHTLSKTIEGLSVRPADDLNANWRA